MSSFGGLEIARRGLTAQLKSMEVAGQNIANAHSPGYSRQVALHTLTVLGRADQGRGDRTVMGGVEIAGIYRQYDAFLTARVRQLTSHTQEVEARHDVLARLEELLHEPGEATIGTALDELWSAFGQLATNPGSEAARNTVLYQAQSLAQAMREAANDMLSLQLEQAERVRAAVNEVNALTANLADVNQSIAAATKTAGVSAPNALLDQRDALLGQLAELVEIQVTERPQGDIRVLVAGRTLVDGGQQTALALHSQDGKLGLVVTGRPVEAVGGALAGTLTTHNEDIPKYMALLDELAQVIISEVNTLHAQGYTPAGHLGEAFFAGTGAGDITVAVGAEGIAASLDEDGRDGVVAQRLANLRHDAVVSEQPVGQRYAALVAELGAQTASLDVRHDNLKALTQFAQMRRESVSGVSLDEELIDVLRFQQSYAASARMLTAIDEALDVLINRTGLVGR